MTRLMLSKVLVSFSTRSSREVSLASIVAAACMLAICLSNSGLMAEIISLVAADCWYAGCGAVMSASIASASLLQRSNAAASTGASCSKSTFLAFFTLSKSICCLSSSNFSLEMFRSSSGSLLTRY